MAEDALARANVMLYMTEPYYAHVLQNLPRRVGTTTPTLAVTQTRVAIELHVNPTFFCGLSREQRVAVLKHEILHIALRHLVRRAGRRHDLWNLACDLVVNDLIGKWPLPAGAVTRATFPDLRLPSEVTAEQVYARLEALVPTNNGTGAAAKNAPRSAEALARAVAARGCTGGHSDHDAWQGRDDNGTNAGEPASAAHALLASALLDGVLLRAADRTSARDRAALPAAIREAITAAHARTSPRLDWRRTLRLFLSGTGRTRLATTYRRESTRYGAVGLPHRVADPQDAAPARFVPGTKILRHRVLLVAVDTSGSISPPQVRAFFDEIHAIWRSGASVRVVTCDSDVRDVFAYAGQPPTQVGGGGGTAFEPVFAWLRTQRNPRFDGVVYLTDGHGQAPQTRPACKLLWVVTDPTGLGAHLRFGRTVLLPSHDDDREVADLRDC